MWPELGSNSNPQRWDNEWCRTLKISVLNYLAKGAAQIKEWKYWEHKQVIKHKSRVKNASIYRDSFLTYIQVLKLKLKLRLGKVRSSIWTLHDKMNRMICAPRETQISLGICPVWPESSLSAWRKHGPLATNRAHSKDSDQTGRMPRLIWVFAERAQVILLVLSCAGSYFNTRTYLSIRCYFLRHYILPTLMMIFFVVRSIITEN